MDGKTRDEVLTNIMWYPAKCARIIVDEKNEATCLPYCWRALRLAEKAADTVYPNIREDGK